MEIYLFEWLKFRYETLDFIGMSAVHSDSL